LFATINTKLRTPGSAAAECAMAIPAKTANLPVHLVTLRAMYNPNRSLELKETGVQDPVPVPGCALQLL